MDKAYRFRSAKSIKPELRASMAIAANKPAAKMAADMGERGIELVAASWDVPKDVLRAELVKAGYMVG